MRKLILSATLALATGSAFAQTGNVGVGVNNPTTKLDLSGAFTNRQAATDVTASGTTAVIPANLTNSQYRIGGTPTGAFTITGPTNGDASGTATTLQYGARMILVNNTAYTGTLNGFPIATKQAVEFVWGNNGADGWIATNGGYTPITNPAPTGTFAILSGCGITNLNNGSNTLPAATTTYALPYTISPSNQFRTIDSGALKTIWATRNLITWVRNSGNAYGDKLALQLPGASGFVGQSFYFVAVDFSTIPSASFVNPGNLIGATGKASDRLLAITGGTYNGMGGGFGGRYIPQARW